MNNDDILFLMKIKGGRNKTYIKTVVCIRKSVLGKIDTKILRERVIYNEWSV
jgi:hypothetical protein